MYLWIDVGMFDLTPTFDPNIQSVVVFDTLRDYYNAN